MHVLVVMSDPDLRATLRDMLEAEGYRVSTAADSQTARAVLWWNKQPLVVLVEAPNLRDLLAAGQGASCAFIVLATDPAQVPPPFNTPAMQLLVPVLAMPFELDDLLVTVAAAAARLGDPVDDPVEAGSR
jgi:CheY-like chemotaxis protein